MIGPHVTESVLNPAITGVFGDTRELVTKVLDSRQHPEGELELLVEVKSQEEPVWVSEEQLPPILVQIYQQGLRRKAQLMEKRKGNRDTQDLLRRQQEVRSAVLKRVEQDSLERVPIKRPRTD